MDTARLPGPRPADRWSLFGIALALVGLRIVGFVLLAFLVVAVCLLVIWIGLPLLLAFLATLRWFARLHRRLAGRVLGTVVLDPYLPVPEGGLFVRLRVRLTDRATWRDVAWLFEVQTIGFALQLAALISFPFLPVGWWGSPLLLRMDASVTRLLLASQDEPLHQRIDELESSRQDTVDHSSAELRRIERDLHDGAQAQLVALGMNLGLAQELVTRDPAAAADLIAEARVSSSTALSDLRSLVRGIYPPVLADRGLPDAIRALALDTPLHTVTDIELPGRPDLPVESACYFAVAEALANAVKHAGARHVQIHARNDGALLRIEVTDDGAGGADPARGTGLRGLERRLATFDGILAVNSPPGGPTLIVIEVPCALSSPKTSSS